MDSSIGTEIILEFIFRAVSAIRKVRSLSVNAFRSVIRAGTGRIVLNKISTAFATSFRSALCAHVSIPKTI